MPIPFPYPTLPDLVRLIGDAGSHLAQIGASEGAAGNISVLVRWPVPEVVDLFPRSEEFALPLVPEGAPAPELAGTTVIVTGSGRRLREVAADPQGNLGVLQIGEDGRAARLYTSRKRLFQNPTTELVSHLGIHRWFLGKDPDANFHAVVHAQPLHIVYLSHQAGYQDQSELNRRLLRWQPETIVQVPEGIGHTPYTLPGSPDLMRVTLAAMERHRAVLWAKHGLIVRSDASVKKAVDLIEYVEVAARYEYMNRLGGDAEGGLTPDDLRALCAYHGVAQTVF
ncbi:MAG TPA: class II aldolase/adducin family protein [Armatimonadaceae bacterium]|nr:class II aldolase/adducin family protein [Armatimonadaceae bacterium]